MYNSAPSFGHGVNQTIQMDNNSIRNQGGSNYTFGNIPSDDRNKLDISPMEQLNLKGNPIEEEKKEESLNDSNSEDRRARNQTNFAEELQQYKN
mmetsp:Transcript_3779/g.4387  ORF Transcript_3779/g.4387 Transcript_3779/m.4387 type:complete len:94 (+) Transcript_3779:399-680(+)